MCVWVCVFVQIIYIYLLQNRQDVTKNETLKTQINKEVNKICVFSLHCELSVFTFKAVLMMLLFLFAFFDAVIHFSGAITYIT